MSREEIIAELERERTDIDLEIAKFDRNRGARVMAGRDNVTASARVDFDRRREGIDRELLMMRGG